MAGFNPNQRRHQSGKERQHLRASELSFENGLSRIVDAVNLKDVLGQIQISGVRRADVTGVGAWVPSCRGFGIAKILKKPQLHTRQGCYQVDVG